MLSRINLLITYFYAQEYRFWSFKGVINASVVQWLACSPSSVVDRGIGSRSDQTEDYVIGMCCFSAKYAALRRKSKDWLARNQDNVSGCADISTRGLLFQWASIIKNTTKRVGLVQSGPYHYFIEINLFSPWYSWTIVELALSNNHSLTQSVHLHIRFRSVFVSVF